MADPPCGALCLPPSVSRASCGLRVAGCEIRPTRNSQLVTGTMRPMIVDGHAHAFPYLGGASGLPSAEDHVRLLQRHFTTHPQGGRRRSDNQLATEPTLWDGKTPGYE